MSGPGCQDEHRVLSPNCPALLDDALHATRARQQSGPGGPRTGDDGCCVPKQHAVCGPTHKPHSCSSPPAALQIADRLYLGGWPLSAAMLPSPSCAIVDVTNELLRWGSSRRCRGVGACRQALWRPCASADPPLPQLPVAW